VTRPGRGRAGPGRAGPRCPSDADVASWSFGHVAFVRRVSTRLLAHSRRRGDELTAEKARRHDLVPKPGPRSKTVPLGGVRYFVRTYTCVTGVTYMSMSVPGRLAGSARTRSRIFNANLMASLVRGQ